jgi:hypothetical protein
MLIGSERERDKTMTKDNETPGLENARGWYASIVEMVEALETAQEQAHTGGDETYAVESRIHESVLSVEVRSGWRSLYSSEQLFAAEYRILLTTGGPALQLVGTLDEHGEPETAELQGQDWFKPWTDVPWAALIGRDGPDPGAWEIDGDVSEAFDKVRETLLTFARCFYFGE